MASESDPKRSSKLGASSSSGDSGASSSSLGPWLRKARVQRNTTEAELARALGIAQAEVAMIERGDRTPTPDVAQKIRAWIRGGHHEGGTPKRGPYNK